MELNDTSALKSSVTLKTCKFNALSRYSQCTL